MATGDLMDEHDSNASSAGDETTRDLASLADSTRQIARMRDDWQRDAAFMAERRLIHPGMTDRAVLDEFRNLRTRLLQHSKGDNAITLVAGVGGTAGSTLVALNLSIAYALDSAKTALLIDCHVQDPRLARLLDIDVDKGLTDYLVDDSMGVDAVLYQTGIPRLRLIPAGSHFESSTEFFTSLRMRAFLQSVKQRYPDRFLIISAPPLDESADSRILVDLCDQALVVAPYGEVSENRLLEVANTVGQERLAGVVLNRVPRPPFSGK
jgi:Mrp family chromosome partitioning ATPase